MSQHLLAFSCKTLQHPRQILPILTLGLHHIAPTRRNYAASSAPSRAIHHPGSLNITPDILEGKVISITGAASGIGFALAKLLIQRGAKVSISDINSSGLDKAATELRQLSSTIHESPEEAEVAGHKAHPWGDTIHAQQVDITDRANVHDWLEQTVEKFGHLDGAANVAGVLQNALVPEGAMWHEADESNGRGWDWVIGVNLTGMANCLRAELTYLHDRPSGAAIVNVASIAGLRAVPTHTAYVASKHGVVGLTRSLALEYARKGVRVNAVAPGAVDTNMMRQTTEAAVTRLGMSEVEVRKMYEDASPMGRIADPEEIAKVMAFLLSEDASYVTGAVWGVDGGLGV